MAPKSLKPLRSEFANRLRRYRVPRGYRTARMFAKALDIDENRYTRYERAEVEPDLALLARMCTMLEVTPNDLLGFPTIAAAAPLTGFAEAGAGAAAGAQPALAGTPAESGSRNPRALAWQIACKLAAQQLDGQASRDAAATLKRITALFTQIEADPFAFVVAMADKPALKSMPPARQAELVAAMNALLSGTAGDIGAGPGPGLAPTPAPTRQPATRAPRRRSPS